MFDKDVGVHPTTTRWGLGARRLSPSTVSICLPGCLAREDTNPGNSICCQPPTIARGFSRLFSIFCVWLFLLVLQLDCSVVEASGGVTIFLPQGHVGGSIFLSAEFSAFSPEFDSLKGHLLYRGSSCAAHAPFSGDEPLFVPQFYRLAVLRNIKAILRWLSQRVQREGDAKHQDFSEWSYLHWWTRLKVFGNSGMGEEPSVGDEWRASLLPSGAARRWMAQLLVPFSSWLWQQSADSLDAPFLGRRLDSRGGLRREDACAERCAFVAGNSEGGRVSLVKALGDLLALRGGASLFAVNPKGLAVPLGQERPVWLFDHCSDEEMAAIVKAANDNGVGALLFTDSHYPSPSFFSLLWRWVWGPRPQMPLVVVRDSPALQRVKQAAATSQKPLQLQLDSTASLTPKAAHDLLHVPQDMQQLFALSLAGTVWGLMWFFSSSRCCRGTPLDRHVTPLHHLMRLPPVSKVVSIFLHMALLQQKPSWTSHAAQYILTGAAAAEAFFAAIFFTVLLLLATGLFLTRETLNRGDLLIIACIVSLLSNGGRVFP